MPRRDSRWKKDAEGRYAGFVTALINLSEEFDTFFSPFLHVEIVGDFLRQSATVSVETDDGDLAKVFNYTEEHLKLIRNSRAPISNMFVGGGAAFCLLITEALPH